MSSTPKAGSPSAEWLALQRDLALLVAHDLRNPIAALMANVSYLELAVSTDDREALEALTDMRRACEQVLRTVENQVAIARFEAAANNGPRTEIALGDLVVQSVNRFQNLLREAGVDLTFRDESRGATVEGDPMALETMADNLLASVQQHVGRGGKARLAIEADANHVTIALDDDGTAFGATDRDFSREGQASMKSQSDTRYTRGLGLYVVGLVVAATKGTIETSRATPGGHVRIVLPRVG